MPNTACRPPGFSFTRLTRRSICTEAGRGAAFPVDRDRAVLQADRHIFQRQDALNVQNVIHIIGHAVRRIGVGYAERHGIAVGQLSLHARAGRRLLVCCDARYLLPRAKILYAWQQRGHSGMSSSFPLTLMEDPETVAVG